MFILEYYEDGSLYDLLHKRKEKLSTMAQLQYALGIAKGMEYLHTRNPPIIHRDLKSNNVMVKKKHNFKFLCAVLQND